MKVFRLKGKKSILTFMVCAFPLLMTACTGWKVTVSCRAGQSESARYCEVKGEKTMSTIDPGSSAGLMSIDLSKSTASINSSQIYLTITAYDNSATLGSQTFNFTKTGGQFIPANSASIETFILNHEESADKFGYSTSEFDASATGQGTNTVVAEVKYDGTVLQGGAYSWYESVDPTMPQDQY